MHTHTISRDGRSAVLGNLYVAWCYVSDSVSDVMVCFSEQAGRFTRVIHPLDSMTQSVDGTDFGRWVTTPDNHEIVNRWGSCTWGTQGDTFSDEVDAIIGVN